ncbi:DUF2145 domain-containing protein [Chitinimonas lacunae]|uniref:DUF2145 domain-containing protein n=1 Tax=Chitinimonas lacunae TaxID=1963018 RepID=A0ABV8MME0_9NEIS
MKAVGALVVLLALTPALAGQNCEARAPSFAMVSKSFQLGLAIRHKLDASDAKLALLARVGRDMSRYQLRYSHMGFVVRDHPRGPWTVVHLLNHCASDRSELFEEGLANFFLDDMFAYEALLLIPTPAQQERLVKVLAQPRRLFEARYNLVAYPFSTRYQNSNQWLLETLADSQGDRHAAQQWLQEQGYRPSTLRIPTLTRLGGRMFSANIAFDDHPFDRRMAGRIDVVTVESLVEFLQRQNWLSAQEVVTLPPSP